jgi:hypothetical protein
MSLSQDILGFELCGEDQRPARALYGDAAYEAIVADQRRRRHWERLRLDTMADRIDDVASQVPAEDFALVEAYGTKKAAVAVSLTLCAGMLGFWGFA